MRRPRNSSSFLGEQEIGRGHRLRRPRSGLRETKKTTEYKSLDPSLLYSVVLFASRAVGAKSMRSLPTPGRRRAVVPSCSFAFVASAVATVVSFVGQVFTPVFCV
jgi:hypothetical protein